MNSYCWQTVTTPLWMDYVLYSNYRHLNPKLHARKCQLLTTIPQWPCTYRTHACTSVTLFYLHSVTAAQTHFSWHDPCMPSSVSSQRSGFTKSPRFVSTHAHFIFLCKHCERLYHVHYIHSLENKLTWWRQSIESLYSLLLYKLVIATAQVLIYSVILDNHNAEQ